MTPRIVVTRNADRDLDELFLYIGRTSPEAAVRFFDAAQATFAQLAAAPHLGGPPAFRASRLEGIRVWRVRGFERHLVFYRPIANGIEVVRVLHGARDIATLFE